MSLGVRVSAAAALVAAIVIGPGQARADVSAFVGAITFDSAANLDSSPGFGIRWGKSRGLLGGETSLTIARPAREVSEGSEETATAIFYEGRILLNFPVGQLRPFVGVGFGAVTVTSTDLPDLTNVDEAGKEDLTKALSAVSDIQTNSALSYGAGVRYKVSEKLDLRLDVRQYQVFSVAGIAANEVRRRMEAAAGDDLPVLPESDDGRVQHNELSIGVAYSF
jgi:opacity protein-like surface antigen